jgi:hypothetical protein
VRFDDADLNDDMQPLVGPRLGGCPFELNQRHCGGKPLRTAHLRASQMDSAELLEAAL